MNSEILLLQEIRDLLKPRPDIDQVYQVSASQPYILDRKERKYLYLYTTQTLALSIEDFGSITTPAVGWLDLTFLQGIRIYATNQVNPVPVLVKCTDNPIEVSSDLTQVIGTVTANQGGVWTVQPGNTENTTPWLVSNNLAYPQGAIPITAQTGNVAATATTATLVAIAARTTYITGFSITGNGATVGSIILITVTGTVTGTLTYVLSIPTGATFLNPIVPLIVTFPYPIPATGLNTAIVVNVPSFGAGNTNAAANAYGFQL